MPFSSGSSSDESPFIYQGDVNAKAQIPATSRRLHPFGPPISSFNSTPIWQRILGHCLPDDKSQICVKKLAGFLNKGLDPNVIQCSSFFDHLFPPEHSPFIVNENLLHSLAKLEIWNEWSGCFINTPASFSEVDLSTWLNGIRGLISCIHGGKRCKRLWWWGNSHTPPSGSPIIRKPDLVLLERPCADSIIHGEERTHWPLIHAFGEVTAEKVYPKRMFDTIDGKSYCIFLSKQDR